MMKSAHRLLLACTLACAFVSPLCFAAPAGFAQDADDPAANRSTEFRAVDGPTQEDISGGGLMLGAYGTILVLLIGYVVRLAQLQAGTSREVERLERAMGRATAAASKAS